MLTPIPLRRLALVIPLAASGATQAAPLVLDIPAQPLASALRQLGEASGLTIAVDSALVQGRPAPAVRGKLEASDALARLLAGSGLSYQRTGNTLLIGTVDQEALELEATSVTGTTLSSAGISTEGTGSYAAKGASILKGAQSLKEIPQSVSVITNQQITDQRLTSLSQVMEQAPGIYSYSDGVTVGAVNGNSNYFSRGYMITSYMLDGIPTSTLSEGASTNGSGVTTGPTGSSAIYERVEILRGAAGLLLGNGSPGGTVNLVRKRPTTDFRHTYTLSTGSWDNYRGEVDVSGALADSGEVRGRLVAAYEDRDRFWGITESQSPLLYGIFEWDLAPNTKATLGARYEKYKENATRSSVFWLSDYEPSRSHLYNPDWGYSNSEDKELFLELQHNFNDLWQLNFSGTHREMDSETAMPRTVNYVEGGLLDVFGSKAKISGIDVNILGSLEAFGREHKIAFGANASNEKWDYAGSSLASYRGDFNFDYDWTNFDPKSSWPETGQMQDFIHAVLSAPRSYRESNSHGLYGKMDFKLTEDLTAIIGGRTSWYDHEAYENDGNYLPSSSGHVGNEFSPYAGLIYALTPEWSAYASYADIFRPQWGYYTRSGSLITHEEGTNYELGIKGELYGGQLNTAFAIYQVDLENTAQIEEPPYDNVCPGNPLGGECYVNTGHKRTRGFDAEVSGELLPNWQAAASYTYTHTEIIRAASGEGGAISIGEGFQTPKHLMKLWSSYRLQGALSGLTLGGGVNSRSKDIRNGEKIQGGYSVWNAFARYEINSNWSASLNVNNVFDKVYWPYGVATYKSIYGEPRSYMLTVQAKY
ncbi:TonB-dependent siderophore receptor [Pseudomonas sp. ABC1]|uniref:TonB-dependent siderophore receptor n=1 Tax=Pseudomonas sp. ABC1 TaxID=2748080 RepID=UPI0015C3AE3A|nr:TonB-dependent siderophore receptor [Pseudomonas sp. ABC1]QLF93077.1 TonB-dependent siderophore receptor [Pseudomonas sp. ABC1]